MKGLRGTELATPFHPLYTPWDRVQEGRIEKWQPVSRISILDE